MTKKMLTKIAAISAAAAIVSALPVIPSAAYDDSFSVDVYDTDYSYCPGYSSGTVEVYTDDPVIDPDRDPYLKIYIANRTNREIAVPSLSEECFIQMHTSEGWVTVYGNENSSVPLYDGDVGCIRYDDNDSYLSPDLQMTQSVNVSEYDDGEYRLGFFTDCFDLHYVYFTIRRNVSAVLAKSRLFSGENELDVRIANNLPCEVELNLDPYLTVLEKFSGGSWKTVEPEEYPEFYEDPILPAYGSDSFTIDLNCFGELTKGEYRLSFDWNAYASDTDSTEDVYGTCRIGFRVIDPVSMSVIPTSTGTRSELLLRVKITNNTDSRIYIRNYGKLQKKSGAKWTNVRFINGVKDISNKKSIGAGQTSVIELRLSDHYYIKPLNSNEYRMEIPIDGRSYYCNFTVTRDTYYTVE